ncbi:hypothetical protein CSIV_14335 [Microbacterium sp. CSI-V]|nr:hypothetical protein CSIV_14335 [Microbacterium sp. CSI-V]
MVSDLDFAVFIDGVLARYAVSPSYRMRLHSEAPGWEGRRPMGICPPEHKHAETGNCYANHRCRCEPCRVASAQRQQDKRTRQAERHWRQERTKTA